MSALVLTRIATAIDRHFSGHIDMSDWNGRPDEDRRSAFLSRGVAALCIRQLAGVDARVAAAAVTDGFHDNCIDAIYFDQPNDTLFLVQSKWSHDGTKSMGADDTGGLVSGIRDLLDARFDRFNEKIRAKEAEIRAAICSDRLIVLRIVTAHTATQPINSYVKSKIDDLLSDLNDAVPVAEGVHLNQAGLYELITSETKAPSIKLQISLKDYGQIEKPFLAYYGRVHVNEIADWWKQHGNGLFTKNLRLFYLNSDVNDALSRTLSENPTAFWYFNNGITLVAETVVKAMIGAPEKAIGLFTCTGASIVNGAQTVGTIGRLGVALAPVDGEEPAAAWVQVRLISLEKCPPEFGQAITRAANLQNAVGNREFAAMDATQHRLATEFALDRRRYVYKQGETDPKGDEGCDIVEATQALAAAYSTALAVLVKREVSALWADTRRSPYTDLFNEKLTGAAVWRSVLLLRAVDDTLQRLRWSDTPKADMIGVHMNRIILNLVSRDKEVQRCVKDNTVGESDLISAARQATTAVVPWMSTYIVQNHDGEYLASLCKNLGKCEAMASAFLNPSSPGTLEKQTEMFE